MALGQLSDLLPAKKFIRGSRSNLLNIDHIRRVDRKNQQCELEKNGEIYSVHISRDMISNFDQIF